MLSAFSDQPAQHLCDRHDAERQTRATRLPVEVQDTTFYDVLLADLAEAGIAGMEDVLFDSTISAIDGTAPLLRPRRDRSVESAFDRMLARQAAIRDSRTEQAKMPVTWIARPEQRALGNVINSEIS